VRTIPFCCGTVFQAVFLVALPFCCLLAYTFRHAGHWYPIQVKQKDKVDRPDIDSFEAVMTRGDRTKGFFVAFDYTSYALREIDGFFRKSGKAIIGLMVRQILDEDTTRKLV
jgi:hypothetical protein